MIFEAHFKKNKELKFQTNNGETTKAKLIKFQFVQATGRTNIDTEYPPILFDRGPALKSQACLNVNGKFFKSTKIK